MTFHRLHIHVYNYTWWASMWCVSFSQFIRSCIWHSSCIDFSYLFLGFLLVQLDSSQTEDTCHINCLPACSVLHYLAINCLVMWTCPSYLVLYVFFVEIGLFLFTIVLAAKSPLAAVPSTSNGNLFSSISVFQQRAICTVVFGALYSSRSFKSTNQMIVMKDD